MPMWGTFWAYLGSFWGDLWSALVPKWGKIVDVGVPLARRWHWVSPRGPTTAYQFQDVPIVSLEFPVGLKVDCKMVEARVWCVLGAIFGLLLGSSSAIWGSILGSSWADLGFKTAEVG